jgi:hypothetical protein
MSSPTLERELYTGELHPRGGFYERKSMAFYHAPKSFYMARYGERLLGAIR